MKRHVGPLNKNDDEQEEVRNPSETPELRGRICPPELRVRFSRVECVAFLL